VMGVFLSASLAGRLQSAGIDPASVSLNSLLDPLSGAASLEGPLRAALAISIANIFLIALVAAIIGLVAVLFAPRGKISQIVPQESPEKITEG